jgi:Peptidase family M1.
MGETPFNDDADEGLMNGKNTGKEQQYGQNFCVRNWKVVFAGTGVVLLITLGVIIGAVFNRQNPQTGFGRGSRSSNFPYDNIRLPGDVIPHRYRLFLHPNITDGEFGFTGKVNILVEAKNESVSRILLHSKDLTIKKILLYEVEKDVNNRDVLADPEGDGEQDDASKIDFKDHLADNKDKEMLMIRLKDGDTLDPAKFYIIHISFKGTLSKGLEGFYRSSYKKKNEKKPT